MRAALLSPAASAFLLVMVMGNLAGVSSGFGYPVWRPCQGTM
nr:hypothetical protein [Kibdelosporangium sp. MJ126-NF4]CTQ96391.1 hypothetical protein [Kibdelosporangium sp. MJ126-NF4]